MNKVDKKKVVVSYNPHSDKTQVSWYEAGKKKSKSFSSESSVSQFMDKIKPTEVRYKQHIRESVDGEFVITDKLKIKAEALVRNSILCEGGCMKSQRKVWVGKTSVAAHRLVFFSKHPSVPQSYFVKRSCANSLCINPEHLYVGYVEQEKDAPIVSKKKKQDFTEVMKISVVQAQTEKEVRDNPSFVRAVRGIKSIQSELEIKKIEYNHSYDSYMC